MMLVDSIRLSDPKTGQSLITDVFIEEQVKLRVHLADGQQLRLTLDQARALQSALSRILDGR